MEQMEVDQGADKIENIMQSLDVQSVEFRRMVENAAKAFGIVQHPDPVITLKAIERRVESIKRKASSEAVKGKKNPVHMIPLESVEIGAHTTNSPQLDNAIRILRLLHGVQLRELQTQINELVADVQKVTANPKCDLSLGKIGR